MQESEADYIGLIMMAKAGYDPQQAVEYWQRMKAVHDEDDKGDPEHLRTHPLYEKRISNVKNWITQALAKREEIN
ncbi:hypothetical protein NQ176_g8114 [Zarea fungicola]|uniref:Uncharacterized protein n=1 Tax=Zarea fungicola TaxID=93591 RepID=A0ACC1MUB2_9HYPO|nr:hypothetical protein NQ176_g8114 [Lecanicillium fungicola]